MNESIKTIRPNKTTENKGRWIAPLLEVLDLNAAEGAEIGPKCDKFGSLSVTKQGVIC